MSTPVRDGQAMVNRGVHGSNPVRGLARIARAVSKPVLVAGLLQLLPGGIPAAPLDRPHQGAQAIWDGPSWQNALAGVGALAVQPLGDGLQRAVVVVAPVAAEGQPVADEQAEKKGQQRDQRRAEDVEHEQKVRRAIINVIVSIGALLAGIAIGYGPTARRGEGSA